MGREACGGVTHASERGAISAQDDE